VKFLPALLFAAAITNSDSAFACSYAVREHPVLASSAPVATGEGERSVRIAISEALLPARFAKTQHVFSRTWLGLRGQRFNVGTGAISSQILEIAGKIDVVCFYPSDAYEVLPDGRLVVWMTGRIEAGDPNRLVLPSAVTETERAGSVWRKVSWSNNETADSVPLPSHPQPGMIQP
jgi:hypothetical protein